MTTPWFIHRMGSMVGSPQVQTKLPNGQWVRAVPLPYEPALVGRLRAAWWVATGRAYAVRWPEAGELEAALSTEGH